MKYHFQLQSYKIKNNLQGKKLQKNHKQVEAKQYTTKESMDHWWNKEEMKTNA